MADKSGKDGGIKDMVKQVYDVWERTASEQIMKIAKNQVFLTAMAQNLEKTLNLTGRVKEITQTTMGVMNLPTKQDFDALAKQVRMLNAAVGEINEKLDRLMPPPPEKPAAEKTKRTRKPKTTE